jgi:hypothetical protein
MLHFAVALAVAANAPAVALNASPARAVLLAPAARTVQVMNVGSEPVVVNVAWKSLERRGGANGWLTIAPRRLVLPRRGRAILTVRAATGASPGDHEGLVLLTGGPVSRAGVAVQLRLGVRLRIRAPGRLVHRIALTGLRVRRAKRRRALLVSITNHGNVTEQLRGRIIVTLVAHDRVLSRLRLGRFRELYPGTRAAIPLPYAGRAHGLVTAIVSLQVPARTRLLQRRYRLLL